MLTDLLTFWHHNSRAKFIEHILPEVTDPMRVVCWHSVMRIKKYLKSYHGKIFNTVYIGSEQLVSGRYSQQCTLLDRQGHDQRVSQQDEEWKAAGHSSLVSEMVKTKGEAWVDMITDLVNQILVK